LADVFGASKIVFTGGVISSIANFSFGIGNGLWHLISAQCLNGLGQGCGFTPILKILDKHFPVSQRARVLGLVMTSTAVFNVAAFYLSGLIGQVYGWRNVFLLSSISFIIVLIIFMWAMGQANKETLVKQEKKVEVNRFSMDEVLKICKHTFSKEMWLLSLGFFCLCYITYGNLVWLPSFLFETYHISLSHAALLAALYPLAGVISRPLGGYVSDVFFNGERKQVILIGWSVVLISIIPRLII